MKVFVIKKALEIFGFVRGYKKFFAAVVNAAFLFCYREYVHNFFNFKKY